jgi:ferredoxin
MQKMQRYLFLRSDSMKTIRIAALALAVALVAALACITSRETPLHPSKGAYLSADQKLCSGCGRCVVVCNADAITIISNKAVIDPTKCTQCWKCLDACPYDAIY